MIEYIFIGLIVSNTFLSSMIVYFIYLFNHVSKSKENEYYTDYIHKNLVLRIFKPEFEYKAIEGVPKTKILEMGVLSQFYSWILIEK